MTQPAGDLILPENWQITTLGLICSLINGDRGKNYPGRKSLSKEGIPFVNAGDLQEGRISTEHLGYISAETFDRLRSGKFVVDDVLYCIRGSLGKVAFNHGLSVGGIASSLIIVRPNPALVPKYVFYYLMSPLAHSMIAKFDNGTAQPNLSGEDLAKFEVPIPGFRTQQKIVAKIEELFSRLDNGVDALETARRQIDAYRKTIINAALTGELTTEDGSQWVECKVGDLLTDIRYGTAKKCVVDPTKTPVLRIPNVASGRIDLLDLKHADFDDAEMQKLRLESGDILIVRSNGSASLVGLSTIVTNIAVGYAYAGYLIRLRVKREVVLPEFLNLWLHSPTTRVQIERQARSTSGVHNINTDEIKSIPVRLPTLSAQKAIVEKVSALTSEIDAIETLCATELRRGAIMRQAILKQAFVGHLVTQEQSDEPASALLKRVKAEQEAAPKRKSNRRREAA